MSQPAAPLPGLSSHLRAAVCHPGRPATLSCYLWHRVAMRGSLLGVLQMDLSPGSQGSRAESLCLLQGNVRSSRGWGMAERSLGRGEGQERPGDQRCGFVLGHTDPEPARCGEGSPRELPVGAGAWHAVRGTSGSALPSPGPASRPPWVRQCHRRYPAAGGSEAPSRCGRGGRGTGPRPPRPIVPAALCLAGLSLIWTRSLPGTHGRRLQIARDLKAWPSLRRGPAPRPALGPSSQLSDRGPAGASTPLPPGSPP